MSQTPSIGRIVHYQRYGSPGGEHKAEPSPAIITAINDAATGRCQLFVVNPNGLYFNDTPFAETPTPGHWNWPAILNGPTTPPPPPPPNEEPHVPPPQPSGPYRIVHRGSGVPGVDELLAKGFIPGDQVYKAINSEQGGRGGGQVSWFVKQPSDADDKPIPSEFSLAFTL